MRGRAGVGEVMGGVIRHYAESEMCAEKVKEICRISNKDVGHIPTRRHTVVPTQPSQRDTVRCFNLALNFYRPMPKAWGDIVV